MQTKSGIVLCGAMLLMCFVSLAEAGRFGGGRSTGSGATHSATHVETSVSHSVVSAVARGVRSSSGGSSDTGATAVPAKPLTPEQIKQREEQRIQNELAIQKYNEERKLEAARLKEERDKEVALAAIENEKKAAQKKLEAEQQAKLRADQEKEQEYQARISRCKIKPVMTDDEIDECKVAWR